jgi:hypothetical protein
MRRDLQDKERVGEMRSASQHANPFSPSCLSANHLERSLSETRPIGLGDHTHGFASSAGKPA